jgi:hypothetical protein
MKLYVPHLYILEKKIGLQGVDFWLISYPFDKSKESNIYKRYIIFYF